MREIVPVILGPTGSGKTCLLDKIKNDIDIEVISADSRQIYKYLDIGTAKPGKFILDRIPHYLVDIIEPDNFFSSADFAETASVSIDNIFNNNKIPVVCGGTGFYISSLFDGLFKGPGKDENIRKQLIERSKKEEIHKILEEVDKESAVKIHPNDTVRIIRALEVFYITGTPMSQLQKEKTYPAVKYSALYAGLSLDRDKLYERINKRVIEMLDNGWIKEVEKVINMGYNKESPGFKSLGYREIIKFLNNETEKDKMISEIQKLTRNYAKRQITWFRKNKKIKWFNPDEYKQIIEYLKSPRKAV